MRSGGVRLGALQVGMLQALYECGIAPDLLVATSVGALNAAFVASRPQTLATARELVLLPAANPAGVQPTRFEHAGHLIGLALEAVRARLAEQNAGRHLRLVTTEVR